jgi:hypothetical protein
MRVIGKESWKDENGVWQTRDIYGPDVTIAPPPANPMFYGISPNNAAPIIDGRPRPISYQTGSLTKVVDTIFIFIFILIIIITLINTGINHAMCKNEWKFSSKAGVNVGMYALPAVLMYAFAR